MFDKTVCLSLDKRNDEQKRIRDEFSLHNIDVSFFVCGSSNIPGLVYDHVDEEPTQESLNTSDGPKYSSWADRKNSYNAFLCFRKIVQQARDEDVKTLLILEDDVKPSENFGEILPLAWEQLQQVDPSWEMFYLGANNTWHRTVEVASNLLRLNGSPCWHCVCLSHRVFNRILNLPITNPIDGQAGKYIHPRRHSYGAWPNIGLVKPGFSYCENKDVDYNTYFSAKGC